ncbi:MAG: site-specific DNA-methyltransferase [Acidimicrobiia bacterium]|nr:site-specific DNA-methyltransferase [Acidimicrobiia bacterium]MYC58082.1 site-specific DNA-methyltransferase [Acidimicrobiia bacterium]MYI30745.1 site-specific DNA-methyltransferase [Acidimicrobiia bacterium]
MSKLLEIRYKVNKWVSDNFPNHRHHISHAVLGRNAETYSIELQKHEGRKALRLGEVRVSNGAVCFTDGDVLSVISAVENAEGDGLVEVPANQFGSLYEFRFGDGIKGAASLGDGSIDLLLTDPPYSISKAYTCETQVPRRSRKGGGDFIMPKGHFGDWDNSFPPPEEWTSAVLPKVGGWAVVFCAQAQIGEYSEIFEDHGLVAVGPMVWHKTNPVPFNHKFKPINAWEAIMVGKRPGTKFNGHAVHNVFTHKSPSPQQRIHPTQKPVPLLSEFIDLFSDSGDLVLDPFAGSAATIVAAVEKQRRCLAFESDPEIFDTAAKRIADLGMFA